jgi:hypothetical protein
VEEELLAARRAAAMEELKNSIPEEGEGVLTTCSTSVSQGPEVLMIDEGLGEHVDSMQELILGRGSSSALVHFRLG